MSQEQPGGDELDVCKCGDYRRDHENGTGKCRLADDITHGFRQCRMFRLSAKCTKAPEGWYCTREAGHDGPCAAWPEKGDVAVTVKGKCPACGSNDSLFVGAGGYLTCGWIDCPNPDYMDAVDQLIAHSNQRAAVEARIDESRVLNMRFTTVRGNTPKDKLKAEGYMLCRDEWDRVRYERLKELEAMRSDAPQQEAS